MRYRISALVVVFLSVALFLGWVMAMDTGEVAAVTTAVGAPATQREGALDFTAAITATPPFTSYLPMVARNYDPRLPYLDTFSDPDSGWSVDDVSSGRWSYQSGEYEMLIKNQNWWLGARAPIRGVSYYSVETDMRRTSGSGGYYGLIFGMEDWEHFYLFVVSTDTRSYILAKQDSGSWTQLSGGNDSPYINTGSATNHLKVVHNGSQIRYYANDHLLGTASDSSYMTAVDLGLYAESATSVPFTIRYDDFEIKALSGTTSLGTRGTSLDRMPVSGGPAPRFED